MPEFKMPKGNEEFDDMEVNDKGRFPCTIRKLEDGMAELISIDGVPIEGYKDDEEEVEADAMMDVMEQEMP